MKRLVLLAILILGLIGTQIQATDIIKPRVQRNIQTLKEDGCIFVENGKGRAPNRMPSNEQIFQTIIKALEKMTEG